MRLSHSKLTTILSCPATYYLNYIQGIKLKIEKPALAIGSAVHWGIEHNTEDLDPYYKEKGSFNQSQGYTDEQMLAEAMVHGYLYHKDELFKEILKSREESTLTLLDETHELTIESKLKSYNFEDHDFIGIIDLLLLTDKGFIVIDYKTSSMEPDWDKYLDQLYRYMFLLKNEFPDVPIYKIAIINLRKTRIKQKKDESLEGFSNRLKMEYEINDNNLINYHEFDPDTLDQNLLNNYIKNLSYSADAADMIDKSKIFYINYANADGIYGKSSYWDIFYHTPDCYVKYNIKDTIFDEDEKIFKEVRDCVPIDMEVMDRKDILNKFEIYDKEWGEYFKSHEIDDMVGFKKDLKSKYKTDDSLLDIYENTKREREKK